MLAFGFPKLCGLKLVSNFLFDAVQFLIDQVLNPFHHFLLQFFVSNINAHVEHLECPFNLFNVLLHFHDILRESEKCNIVLVALVQRLFLRVLGRVFGV